jgi:hypothetical protein
MKAATQDEFRVSERLQGIEKIDAPANCRTCLTNFN